MKTAGLLRNGVSIAVPSRRALVPFFRSVLAALALIIPCSQSLNLVSTQTFAHDRNLRSARLVLLDEVGPEQIPKRAQHWALLWAITLGRLWRSRDGYEHYRGLKMYAAMRMGGTPWSVDLTKNLNHHLWCGSCGHLRIEIARRFGLTMLSWAASRK